MPLSLSDTGNVEIAACRGEFRQVEYIVGLVGLSPTCSKFERGIAGGLRRLIIQGVTWLNGTAAELAEREACLRPPLTPMRITALTSELDGSGKLWAVSKDGVPVTLLHEGQVILLVTRSLSKKGSKLTGSLSQLLYSAYFKSTITTVERRFGLTSSSSGLISSLHEVRSGPPRGPNAQHALALPLRRLCRGINSIRPENVYVTPRPLACVSGSLVGNMILIMFVSYMGNHVHRPRIIGLGGLLMSVSALILALPHFLSSPYVYSSSLNAGDRGLCMARNSSETCSQGSARHITETNNLWLLMAIAQLLFGVGSVPIQPFGISYVDDFAGPENSPLYIVKAQELTPTDPRWVGAWWMGLLVSAGFLALSSIPYFCFPRSMHEEDNVTESDMMEDSKSPDMSFRNFLKKFPRLFVRLLLSPLFLLLVLAQCCFSSVIAALATFLNKFLERQYSTSAAYASLLMGAMNLPMVAVGMLLGGVIMKRIGLSMRAIPRFSVAMLLISIMLCVPLFFMGCSTQRVAGVNIVYSHQDGLRTVPMCTKNCSCPKTDFNPVCGSDGIEYVSPCQAGCTDFSTYDNSSRIQRTQNDAVLARPGSCPNSCPHLLLPVMVLISLAGFVASLSHNPVYMMVLRSVPPEEKSFAIGVQFLIMRVLAWLPAPAIFGAVIDSTCILWKRTCGSKPGSCGYYDNDLLRDRYLGLQVGFKAMGIFLLGVVGWKVQRMRVYSLETKFERTP
ncbi:hypothetical protein JZ751_019095 [Albula glossodonta]|uniref:Solute carrier organic anion transporter family member n=1 Tax=Albula glossodonta TaxID=121402 RepID=A0A8T2NVG0_9TELE|nr:hypothetical protein JZ751_019095 [Albula glossodonta]